MGEKWDQEGGYNFWGPQGTKRQSLTSDDNLSIGWGGSSSLRLQTDTINDYRITTYQTSFQDSYGLSFQSLILKFLALGFLK